MRLKKLILKMKEKKLVLGDDLDLPPIDDEDDDAAVEVEENEDEDGDLDDYQDFGCENILNV
ncbi:hypothetical protein L195_g000414 [Trifolium pratense]|uniref:Uncharacterized protein n=1 Tax=Trifolium pratense TaxID=57577 RepID=A0A2K3NLU3_TRIPR|nr:hypothetical protein L195_g000414 [Trifolium pratense]